MNPKTRPRSHDDLMGGVAEAFYRGVPKRIASRVMGFLDDDLRKVTVEFRKRYPAV